MRAQRAALIEKQQQKKAAAGGGVVARARGKRRGSLDGNIDIQSTLATFGLGIGFDVHKYISDQYKESSVSHAEEHKIELELRRQVTSDALKAFVTENYTKFISTSKEIANIESEMLKLTHMLNDFKTSLKSMQEINFSYTDEHTRMLREREEFEEAQAKSPLGEVIVEEMNEDLRTLVMERKFDQAVAAIEYAHERISKVEAKQSGGGTAAGDQNQLRREVRRAQRNTRARVDQLVELLTFELRAPNLKKYERRRIIAWMVRLGHSDKALSIFLQNRSLQIRADVRQISFQGDITVYIAELSTLVFSSLSSAVTDFHRLFDARTQMMSSVMSWCIDEMEVYGSIIQKQVFTSEEMFGRLGRCLKHAYDACALLEKKGLSLSFVLARLFHTPLLTVIAKNYKSMEQLITEVLATEKWRMTELWVADSVPPPSATATKPKLVMANLPTGIATKAFADEKSLASATAVSQTAIAPSSSSAAAAAATAASGTSAESPRGAVDAAAAAAAANGAAKKVVKRALKLTDSAKFLYDIVRKLLKDVSPILDNSVYPAATSELYPAVVQGAIKLFEGYLIGMAGKAKDGLGKLDDQQSLSIVANAFYLADDLLPRVTREFSRQFRRPIPELEAFRNKIERLHEALGDEYCTKKAAVWIASKLQWTSGTAAAMKRYSAPALSDHEHASPSPPFLELVKQFVELREMIIRCLNPQSLDTILSLCLEEILRTLHDAAYWEGFVCGHGGLQQFVLDLRFLVASAHGYVTRTASDACVSLIKRAIQLYASTTGQRISTPEEVLETELWFNTMIEAALKRTNTIGKLAAAAAAAEEAKKNGTPLPAAAAATATTAAAANDHPSDNKSAAAAGAANSGVRPAPTPTPAPASTAASGGGAPPAMPSRANKPAAVGSTPQQQPQQPVAAAPPPGLNDYAAAVAAAPPAAGAPAPAASWRQKRT